MRRALEWCVRICLKWLQSLYEMLCIMPVLLLLGALIVPERYQWLCLGYLAGGYLWGLLLGLPLKKSRMWLRLLIVLAGAIVPACFLFPAENWAPIVTAVGITSVYRGSVLTYRDWEEHYPLPVSWIGLVLYLLFSYLFTRGEILKPYLPFFTLTGLVFIVTTVFALNHRAMRKSVPSREETIPLPRRMIKQNRWLIALLAVFVLVIGLFRTIKDTVAAAAAAVFAWFMGVLESLYGNMQQVPLEDGGMPMLPPAGETNSLWQTVLTVLLYIVGGAICLSIIAGVFVVLWNGLKRLYRALLDLLGRRSEPMSQGYIDQRESLWDMEMARRTLSRTRRWIRTAFTPRDRWRDMRDNRQRARFLYRSYIRRAMAEGFKPDPAATAADTLTAAKTFTGSHPEALADLYADARYGDIEPADAAIAAVKDALD